MIVIKNYVNESEMFVTSLTHEALEDLQTNKYSAVYPLHDTSKQKTYWIAEPSALKMLKDHCQDTGNLFLPINVDW